MRLKRDVPPGIGKHEDLADYLEGCFPVIELHNAVFRGPAPTSQELVAGNAMHAGSVVSSSRQNTCLSALAGAEIQIEIDGELVETKRVAELPGGPLGSVRWLASSLASAGESLKAGDLVLTGSPGRLIAIRSGCRVAVACEGQCAELYVDAIGSNDDPLNHTDVTISS